MEDVNRRIMNDMGTKLKSIGIDYDAAMQRFHNNESMYFKYLFRLPDEVLVNEATSAFQTDDFAKASFAIHTLKSVIGNLAVNSLYELTVEIMEKLRYGDNTDAKALFLTLFLPQYNAIAEALTKIKQSYENDKI